MDAGFPGIGFDGVAELLDGVVVVAHLVVGFAGEHVGFRGLGVEIEYLMIDVEDALILLGPEATMREDEAIGKVLRIARCGIAQIWNGSGVFGGTVVGRAEEETETLRVGGIGGRVAVEGFEDMRGCFEIAGFEEGEAHVELEAWHGGVDGGGATIVADRVGVMLLLRRKEAEMGAGFGVAGVRFQDGLPCGFGGGGVALLFEGEGGVSLLR